MIVEIFSLCDAATNEHGKLNILGAFDTIWGQEFPVVYPHCSLAVRLRISALEQGSHRVDIRFIDEDGKDVLPTTGGPFQVNMAPEQRSAVTNLVLNIQSLKLNKAGEYAIEMALDGQMAVSLPLFVRPMPAKTK